MYFIVPNFIKMIKAVKRLRRYGDLAVFQNGGRLPFLICMARIGNTHDD